jgi:hypothetical protein
MDDRMTSAREREMRDLAARLFFEVEERGGRYSLSRTVDVPEPVRREDLTLAEAEDVLRTFTLRGEHGG